MAYVIRNEAGEITGANRWPIPGVQKETVADDDPEIIAFNARVDATLTPAAEIDARLMNDPVIRALVGALADRFGITEAELMAEIKASAGN